MRIPHFLFVLAIMPFSLKVAGQAAQSAMPLPIAHPAIDINLPYTTGAWRSALGTWGEGLVREELTLRGFEVYEPKVHGNKGIDAIAVKRNVLGEIVDIRIIEVKTRNGYGKPSLGNTKRGKQLSRAWLNDKLRIMRASGDPELKKLANDIRKFRERTGIAIEKLGELHEVNPRSGKLIVRNPITGAEISSQNIGKVLQTLSERAKAPEVRKWAADQFKSLELIRSTTMSKYLGASALRASVAFSAVSSRASRYSGYLVDKNISAIKMSRLVPKVIGRAAGPVGVAIGTYMDAHELHEIVKKYQSGSISRSELYIQLSRTGGGMGGAAAGFAAGAALGAGFTSWTGPGAVVSALIGGGIGAGIGYIVGAELTAGAAQLYVDLGQAAREHNVDKWVQNTSYSDALRWSVNYNP